MAKAICIADPNEPFTDEGGLGPMRPHPLMVLAHPQIIARGPEDLAADYEERAAIRTFVGDVDTYVGESAAAREVLAVYIQANREWLA